MGVDCGVMGGIVVGMVVGMVRDMYGWFVGCVYVVFFMNVVFVLLFW